MARAVSSSEQLEFIFQQFLEGLSDTDIVGRLSQNKDFLPKSASDIKELRGCFEAARKVLLAGSQRAARETTDRLLKYSID